MPLSDPTIVGLVALVIGVIPLSKIAVHFFRRFKQRRSMSMHRFAVACNICHQVDSLMSF